MTDIEAERYLDSVCGDKPYMNIIYKFVKFPVNDMSIPISREFIKKYWSIGKNSKNARFLSFKRKDIEGLRKMMGDLFNGDTVSGQEY